MSHTPGPWTWTYDGSGDYSIGPDDPQVNAVAHIYAGSRRRATASDNAALIAAAPELLAALTALVAETERRDNPADEGVSSDDETMIAALAAIAKAEGR